MTQVLILFAIICVFTNANAFFANQISSISKGFHDLNMKVTLHGSPQSRSPLVNWYLIEKNIPFTQAPARPSNHPFGQIPFLTDDVNGVEVFESGAILLYLADAYGGNNTPKERASYTKWVVWANSELDGLCFGKRMSGTSLDKPNQTLDRLESILKDKEWLVDNNFSVADIAVGSYLNYVPVFFRGCNPSSRPNIVKYMLRCAQRPAFTQAFGEDHGLLVQESASKWLKAK